MGLKHAMKIKSLQKEIARLRDENERLKESQKRCNECERFDRRRGFAEDPSPEPRPPDAP